MKRSQLTWHGKEVMAALRKATPEGLFAAGEELIRIAASKAPRQSGDLAESGYVTSKFKSTYKSAKNHRKEIKTKGDEVAAGFAAFYSAYVEYGTKPHTAGKAGQVLRMEDGSIVRGPLKHPGSRPKPFFRPALDESKPRLLAIVAQHAGKPLK